MNSYVSKVLRPGVCRINREADAELYAPMPTLPAAIPDFDGLLPVTALDNDLEIRIPWWNGIEQDMRLQAAWKVFIPDDPNDPGDTELVGVRHIVTADEAADNNSVFTLLVPQDAFRDHGVYILRVRASSFPGGANDWSERVTVRVDKIAPGGGALPFLIFPPNVEQTSTITDADIDNGFLPVSLAHYQDIARGDTIDLYINQIASSTEYLSIDPDPSGFIRLAYPEADLLAAGNGIKSFYYKVTDKAGNFAGSFVQNFDIQLRTTPTFIPKPTVPQADPDILDEAEARAGTNVGITKFDNAQAGDEIEVHWGSQTSARYPLLAGDLANNPFITIQLAYSLVVAETSKGKVNVTFEVFRNGSSIGTSQIDEVNVDLTIPGGPDPDPETPINENLLPTIIRSAGNGNPPPPGEDNLIPPEDFDQDATAIIPWLDKNGDDIYQLDDQLELTWGAQTAATIPYTIVQQDVDDGQDLKLTVPAATIHAEGAGVDITVFYTISRLTSAPPVENTAIAPSTLVEVIGPSELPGGGTVDKPVFTVLNENDAIGQNELIGSTGRRYNPVQTRVDYDNVEAGDSVQLFFSGYNALEGGTLIPGATYEPVHTLTAADIAAGNYEFQVSATYHFAVCSRGHVEAYVVFTNSRGSAQSLLAQAYCDVKFPNDPDCSTYLP